LIVTVPRGITHLFLLTNVIAMCICSTMVIIRKHSEYAVVGLIGVVITQALGYGLIFDLNFFLRNLSVMGGLLMVLSDSWVRKRVFAGLPQMDEKDRKMYVQLGGRILLVFLFIGFVFTGTWTFWRILVSLFGLVACVMVVVGFKAKLSAVLLVVLLSVFNLFVNNFWTVSTSHPRAASLSAATLSTDFHRSANIVVSFITTILTKISPSTIFSRFCPSCKLRTWFYCGCFTNLY
jgi:uncharacterized membrane protein YphA (DoxX/SURF4 family)